MRPDAKHEDPLEDLLTTALIETSNHEKGKHAVKDLNRHYRAAFTRAENWKLVAQVRLFHVEGNVHTLVGLFDELVHSYVPACRRLVAAASVRELPQKAETVSGPHWLPGDRLELKRQPAAQAKALTVDLTLGMGQELLAVGVPCVAYLVGGGLQRFCIAEDTIFEGSMPRTILSLPAGLDVLEGMTNACKVDVWGRINGN